MNNQELIDQLRGVVRQIEREAAATEAYLKGQIRQLKEQIEDANHLNDKNAFKGGWTARDSISYNRHVPYENIDEHGDCWYAAWIADEGRKL